MYYGIYEAYRILIIQSSWPVLVYLGTNTAFQARRLSSRPYAVSLILPASRMYLPSADPSWRYINIILMSSTHETHGSCVCKWGKFTITIPPTTDRNPHPAHFTSSGRLRATNCHCNTCRQSFSSKHGQCPYQIPLQFQTWL